MTLSRPAAYPPTNPSTHSIATESIADFAIDSKVRAVKLFRNGANQAVRIPKEFELPGTDAVMHREGNRLILELVPDRPKKGTLAALVFALDEIAKLGPCQDEFPDIGDEGLLPLDDIDFGDEVP